MKLLREDALEGEGDRALRWIYRVTTHHCLNLRRDRLRRARTVVGNEDDALEVTGAPSASYPERRLAQQVLARFDSITQAIAIGVLVDGMEHKEVAGVLGVSRRTVHRKLARFLAGARRLLLGEGP